MTDRSSPRKPVDSEAQEPDPDRSESVQRAATSTIPSSGVLSARTTDDEQSEAAARLGVNPAEDRTKRSLVARRDGRTLRRMTVYLPDEIAHRLRVYCAENDQPISRVITDAVRRVIGA